MPKPNMNYCPQCGNPLQQISLDGKERIACKDRTCGYVFWNNPIPVVAAIAERDGKVILVRSHGWPEKWFGLLTGFLERKESPEEAVLREVKEEIGLEGEIGSFVGIYPFFRMNQIIIVYHIKLGQGEVVLEEKELAGYKEVPIEELKPWPMGTGIALRDWLRSKGIEREFIQFG